MRIPIEPGPASMPPRDWRDLVVGMLLLLTYLTVSSAGLTILARALAVAG